MYSPSYLSFEWALAKYNILSQKPVNLTLATNRRSKKIITPHNIIFYPNLTSSVDAWIIPMTFEFKYWAIAT